MSRYNRNIKVRSFVYDLFQFQSHSAGLYIFARCWWVQHEQLPHFVFRTNIITLTIETKRDNKWCKKERERERERDGKRVCVCCFCAFNIVAAWPNQIRKLTHFHHIFWHLTFGIRHGLVSSFSLFCFLFFLFPRLFRFFFLFSLVCWPIITLRTVCCVCFWPGR